MSKTNTKMSKSKKKSNSKTKKYDKTKICHSDNPDVIFCDKKLPITKFRVRNKIKGTRNAQCKDCEKKVADKRRYRYEDTKICYSKKPNVIFCNKELPINKFHLKSRKTRQRESRCGDCILASRDKEQIRKTRKNWYENKGGKELVKKRNEEYKPIRNEKHRNRCETDPEYKMKCLVRNRIGDCLKRNGERRTKKIEYLGMCTYDYKKWMEFQFDEHMTWENHGTYWEIDHVKPIDSFDLTKEDDIHACFNWKNTRPLEKSENNSKHNTVDREIMKQHKKTVEDFICARLCYYQEFIDDKRESYYTNDLYSL